MSISVNGLGFSYGAHRVLTDVSFTADNGKCIAVLGPNGVGKTTLFRCILGLERQYEGHITVDGTDTKALSPRELAHRVAYIPQIHARPFGYSVLDMVLMGTSHCLNSLRLPGKKETDVAFSALDRLGIGTLAEKNYAHLSGGEQQLVLIARALAQQAKTLIMDEPTASLDYGNQAHVLATVQTLATDGYTVLVSTHNPQHALWYADTALALYEGKVAAFGDPQQILDAAMIEQLYHLRVTAVETPNGRILSPDKTFSGTPSSPESR